MRKNSILLIFLVIGAFIAFSWFSKQFLNILSVNELLTERWGMPLYVLVTVVAVVIAPISTVPFIPLAVELWGPVAAALLNIAGWTIGSAIAFLIARIFGQTLIARLVGVKNLHKLEWFLPQRRLFWSVVFLRLVLPVDLLSYALGLFSAMRFPPYLLATLVGVTPFSFIFSYAAELPLTYQLAAGITIIAFVVIVNILLIYRARRSSNTMNQISIIMYYWGGKKFGIKIKNPCAECDINLGILENMRQKEFSGRLVNISAKPWLSNFWQALAYGGWHAPVVIVNGRLFSQGIVIDRKKFAEFALETV